MALKPGGRLLHYELVEQIGEGGMGVVWKAEDTKLHREVAIKVLPAGVASSPERLERFEREAIAVAALNHPNIVTVFGIEESDDHRFIAMELIEGSTLDRIMPSGSMPLAKIFDIATPLSDALAAAHDKGIVHRDLKPANVMVTKEGRVKVLDFGLAKLTAAAESDSSPGDPTMTAPLTGRGMIVGTIPYTSPEQLKGEVLDHRTDLFSLGIVLYEMATGQRPFKGDNSAEVMSSILRDTPRVAHELSSAMPRHLGRIIERCLEKKPEDRYQSAKDVRNELRASNSSSAPGSEASTRSRRRKLWMGVGVIATVLVITGLWIGRGGAPQGEPAPSQTPVSARQQGTMTRLAILPFTDNSPQPQEWLASGLADALSTRLGRINPSALGVLGPETTMYYARPGKSLQDLREDLNVAFVLRGSIQNIGDDVRITANLIQANDLTSVWSAEFNGTMDDPFALQSIVAEKIIADLPFELTGEERVRLQNRYVPKPEAELAYMRGRYFGMDVTGGEKNLLRAVSYFEQAIEIDPEYALPYCGLAAAKCWLATWGVLQTSRIRSEVKDTLARALALDDTLAEAHVSAGLAAMFLNWDWPAAEAAFERAIELNPNHADTYAKYGNFLAFVGRYDEAEERFEEAIRLNPVSSWSHSGLGMILAGLGRLNEAEPLFRQASELNKDNEDAFFWLADVRQKQGRFDDAVEIMERAVFSREHPELAMRCFLGNAYAMAGRMEDARGQLAEMHKMKSEVPGHHIWFGELHAALGEKEEAFRWLDQALADREAWLPHVRLDPGLIHIRSDPRFAELHRKMGLDHVDLSYSTAGP